MNKLASKFGKVLCEEFVALELMAMSDDAEQKVRKAAITNFLSVCKVVSQSYFLNKLLPVYKR